MRPEQVGGRRCVNVRFGVANYSSAADPGNRVSSRGRKAGISAVADIRPEPLEGRKLFAAGPNFHLAPALPDLGSADGQATVLTSPVRMTAGSSALTSGGTTTTSSPPALLTSSPNAAGFDIVIRSGSGLSSNPAALAAFERAATQWEQRISDPVTVYIDADLSALSSTSIIGQTSTSQVTGSYASIRSQMIADSSDEADDGIVASLPSSASFTLPTGFGTTGNLTASKASLKALGYTGLDTQFGSSDGTITFNSRFSFDYDNSDGVSAGKMDFETVAAHEIGHALGFLSSVDTVDYYAYYRSRTNVSPSTMDLFRFANNVSGKDPATSTDFSSFSRSLMPNVDAVTDDVSSEFRMSTGAYTGDGNQASHWKDGDLTGTSVGIMDPTLAYGQVVGISAADWRAMDLIGWDISSDVIGPGDPPPSPPPPTSPPPPPVDGIQVSFFNDRTLSKQVSTGPDADGVVNEDWGSGSPAAEVASDNFSARWLGQVTAPATGDYTFYTKMDDNARLWVNGKLMIRRWGTANTSEWKSATVHLDAGQSYPIQLDFAEISGGASVQLKWYATDASSQVVVGKQIIPAQSLSKPVTGQTAALDPYLTDKDRKNDSTIVGYDNGTGVSTIVASRQHAVTAQVATPTTCTYGWTVSTVANSKARAHRLVDDVLG